MSNSYFLQIEYQKYFLSIYSTEVEHFELLAVSRYAFAYI